jgi:Trypsin-co-occurring domain 2
MAELIESEVTLPAGTLGLAEYLADLRAELAAAQQRAEGASLRLGVEQATVELEVAVTSAQHTGGSGKLAARFYVLSAELGGSTDTSNQPLAPSG